MQLHLNQVVRAIALSSLFIFLTFFVGSLLKPSHTLVAATNMCTPDQVEIVGYGTNTLTARVKPGASCSAYAYVKKYTCSGNVTVCSQGEQTIVQGNLPISASPDPTCGKSVQVDIDVYQSAPWATHVAGGGITAYGGDCPVVTPTPSPTPSPTPTPTPSPTPSPTPTASPVPKAQLKMCKYDDKNGNGTVDSEDKKIGWDFIYRVGGEAEKMASTRWWTQWNESCVTVSVPVGASVSVSEKSKSDWRQTGLFIDGAKANESAYAYATVENQTKTVWFLNTYTPTSTPTPTASPTPTPTPLTCNQSCTSSAQCQNGYVCHQDGSSKYCRHPDNTSSSTCDTRKSGGFFIRKYHDENGNGRQDTSEKGLAWKFQWDQNADNNWRDYETFENSLGEGGVVSLSEGTQVRIREKAVDGWTATTATEVTIRIKANENQLMVFGNWRGKPQVLGTATTKTLPATGFTSLLGGVGSLAMYSLGMWMKKKGL